MSCIYSKYLLRNVIKEANMSQEKIKLNEEFKNSIVEDSDLSGNNRWDVVESADGSGILTPNS